VHRIWAIIERDLRRFRRSPSLMVISMLMPVMQLIVLGHAFGGRVKDLDVGVVDQDHGVPAVKVKEMLQAVAANARTVQTVAYTDQATALADLRNGRISAVLSIPPNFSRKVLAGDNPRLALIEDNTDQFASATLEGTLGAMLRPYNRPPPEERISTAATLSIVEVYPYVPYIQYLLPGTIVLAIFMSAMIGGGIIFIDDKARGLHEGYLVTPIRKFELILGFTLAGALKAILAGTVLVVAGSLIAGIPHALDPLRLLRLMMMVVTTSLALISMMFLLMVRVSDPLIPRAIYGVLSTVLFYPSGAVYPVKAFPGWMQVLAVVDPFTYAVHGFKSLMLKNTGLAAIGPDLAILIGFTMATMGLATVLFRRTL
jgi:ABC-2 type transport system permease protein